ncbi:MAG: hypothetical protein ACMG6E_06970 [Candidatus Roizmanbacteria bacterium]
MIKFSPGNRNYWRRTFGHLAKCPFGKTTTNIISTINQDGIVSGTSLGVQGIISYSLYGNYEKYHVNLFKSLAAIPNLLPGWEVRVYVGVDIPDHIRQKLLAGGAVIVTIGPDPPKGHEAALWRFLPAMEEAPFVSLDADDVFNKKIAKEIKRWLRSGKQFASFKRYPFFLKIAAGLWGSRGKAIPNMHGLNHIVSIGLAMMRLFFALRFLLSLINMDITKLRPYFLKRQPS